MSADEKEIKALINLLDDPDDNIYKQIRSRLVELGKPVIPSLENVWEFTSYGPIIQDRIEDIVHQIQYEQVANELTEWVKNGATDLYEGLYIINKYQYPELDIIDLSSDINRMARQIWIELNDEQTALEKVNIFNRIIFESNGFKANKQNYHSPTNTYLSSVLQTRKGNPLMLSCIYLLIAQQLNEPIFGINLPSHFVLGYVDIDKVTRGLDKDESSVLFYINCFSYGSLLQKKELEDFLDQLDIPHKKAFFEPCHPKDIILRAVNNLIFSYSKGGFPEKVKELEKLIPILVKGNV